MSAEQRCFFREAALLPEFMKQERTTMKSNNSINVPQAKEAMNKFKMQAASDLDVTATY